MPSGPAPLVPITLPSLSRYRADSSPPRPPPEKGDPPRLHVRVARGVVVGGSYAAPPSKFDGDGPRNAARGPISIGGA